MAKTRDLVLRFRALDRVSKTLDKVRKRFPKLARAARRASQAFQIFSARTKVFRDAMNKVGRGMRNVGTTMTTRVSAPIGLAGAAILRTGVMFEKSINKVAAITDTIIKGKITPEFEALEKQALMLGSSTEFSSTQAADAMALLGRAGFKVNEILESTDDVLALASASGMDLAFSADVMAKTIRAFGLSAKDATRVSDVLSDVSRRTNVDLETISETFKDAAPIAKAYGLSLEQTAAITGLLGDVGIQGSKAGTTLKSIMLKLAAPSDKARKFMEAMGISVTDASGKMRSAGKILTEIGPKLAGLNKDKQLLVINELFGLRGIAGAAALMERAIAEGKNPIAELSKALEGSTGAAKEMQATMLRGSVGVLARFQSALEGVGLAFAKSGLLESFASILEDLAKMLSSLSKLNPQVLKTITIIAGLVAILGPALAAIGFMVQGIAQLTIVFAALKAATVFVAGVLGAVTLPMWGIVAAVVAVVAIVGRLIQKWSSLVSAWKKGKGVLDSISRAGKVFFGFGDEQSDGKKKGVKTKSMFGPATGAAAKQQNMPGRVDVNSNQNFNGQLDINFKNAPKGTNAKARTEGPLTLSLGSINGVTS